MNHLLIALLVLSLGVAGTPVVAKETIATKLAFSNSVNLVIKQQFTGASVSLSRIHYSPDGKFLLTSSSEGIGTVWKLTGEPLATLKGQKPPMFNANFSPNGETIITTGYDGTIRLWNLQGELLEERQPHQAAVADALFSPNGQEIVTCSDDGQTQIFTSEGKLLGAILKPGTARNLAYSSNGRFIASVSDNGSLYLITDGAEIYKEIPTEQGRINNVTFSPDNQQILTAGTNGTAKLWDLEGKKRLELKATTTGWVNSAQFHPVGKYIATGSDDGTVRLWSDAGELLTSITLGNTKLNSVSFSPDGNSIAVCGSNGQIWILEVSR